MVKKKIIDFISGEKVNATKEEVEAVQVFSKRLVEEFGYDKKQIQTRPQFMVKASPSAKGKYPVDIAVFNDARKDYDNLYMIVECKKKKEKEGVNQLKIYGSLSPMKIGIWYNGDGEHLYLRKVVKSDHFIEYNVLPTIPKKGQKIESIGTHKRKDLVKPINLRKIFRGIRNHLAGSAKGITKDETFAQQLINILFCKIYDEINTGPEEQVKFRAEIEEEPEDVRKRILELFNEHVKKTAYDDVFEKKDEIFLDAESLFYVVGELQNYCLTEVDKDAIGEAFEAFIGRALKGSEGQFFTPRTVVKAAIKILDPEPEKFIIDPACGSGGFLIVALEHVWNKIDMKGKRMGWGAVKIESEKARIATKYFRGIDKETFLAKVTKAYMALVGDGRGGVYCENSLEFPSAWGSSTRDGVALGKFDYLFTNPPFGKNIKIPRKLYSQYELAREWEEKENGEWKKLSSTTKSNRAPQILFLERCLQLLKDDGKMAIVLPDGMLSNPKDGYIHEFISQNAEVVALVDLPMSTFLPNTPTKTHLVVLKKCKPRQDYPIFMSYAKSCGHDKRGYPTYKAENGNEAIDDDIQGISSIFGEATSKNKEFGSLGYFINKSKITSGIFMPKYYNPELKLTLKKMAKTRKYRIVSFGELEKSGVIEIKRGREVGSKNYGTGNVPFVRTSELSNWEIMSDSTHCVAEDIYEKYRNRPNLKKDDILVVNDGTYLMGRCAILSEDDTKIIIQSHIRRIRVLKPDDMPPELLLFLMGLEIVQKQIEAKTFRQATISTLGNRLSEVMLPIPLDTNEIKVIVKSIREVIDERARLRHKANSMEFNGVKESVMGMRNRAELGNL